ncbi:MAG TPA: phosphotransferase [Ktedonobacteraceae bacterium]|nr:phosphotransferase [Ktedonobacteraceae bacterium]
MDEIAFFLEAVTDLYGKQPIALHLIHRNFPPEKRLYRIDFANKRSWILRAYHRSFVDNGIFRWFSHYPSLSEWLQTQANTLTYLAQHGYPVPHIVPTRTGKLIGLYQDWYILTAIFVEGDARDTSPEKMHALGASLGYLHTMPLPETPSLTSSIGISWWEPHAAIPLSLDQLHSVADHIPAEWREAHAAFTRTFQYFQQHSQLARTIIHADCWAENGIQTQEHEATLIDWECAGLGIAITDLGSLLLHCHFDQRDLLEHQKWPEYQPDPRRIAAVVNGYRRWRQLPPDELDALLDAIRFSIAWRGLWFFLNGVSHGWLEGLQQALRRQWRWYAITEEIARLSRAYFEQISIT